MKAGQGNGRGLKMLGCLCFLLLVVALLLIDRHSPATGYELSIYDSLPALVWICLIGALAGATGMIVHQAFAGDKSGYWLLGFLVLILTLSIMLLLPVFRAYYLYGAADTLAVVGWTRGVLQSGHFGESNRYPVTHVMTAQLSHVTGAPTEEVLKYVPVLFTVLFMLFSYLLASSVAYSKGQALLVAGSGTLFFNYYHVSAYPQTLSIMALPMVFYLYFRSRAKRSAPFRIAFVAVLLLFPYFHPAPAAALIACLLAAEAAKAVWRRRTGAPYSVASDWGDRVTLEPVLICTVTFLTWISAYEIFGTTIRRTLGWLTREIEVIPHVATLERTLEQQGLSIFQQAELALKMYGDNLIYLVLCGIALIIVAWSFWRRRYEGSKVFGLSMPFLISGPVWVLIFATTLRVTVGRLLGANIMMWATPVLAGFALYELFRRRKKAGPVLATAILTVSSVVGIFGVYHSPYILQPSWQTTTAGVRGSQWFLEHRRPRSDASVLGEMTGWGASTFGMPQHFAYEHIELLGSLLQRDFYLLINSRFRMAPEDPTLAGRLVSDPKMADADFNTADFARLQQDSSVHRTYVNGDLEMMWVSAER